MAHFGAVLTTERRYLERCTQFTALYHEFNCFESPEKTTETTSTVTDAQEFKKEN